MNVSLNPKGMWAAVTTTKTLFNNFHFHFHKQNHKHWNFTIPILLLMSNPTTARVSASFSSSPSPASPLHASLKRVGTHNGSFHCDEALGCFMIRLTRKFFDAEIVRTRDAQVGPFSILIIFPFCFALLGLWENLFCFWFCWGSVYFYFQLLLFGFILFIFISEKVLVLLNVVGYWENINIIWLFVCLMRENILLIFFLLIKMWFLLVIVNCWKYDFLCVWLMKKCGLIEVWLMMRK